MLGLITAIGPLSLDMYLPAFPAIAADYGVPDAQVQLSLTTCLIGLALGQLAGGPLSDRWGRRRPIVLSVAAYAIFSLSCALAPAAPVLVALRLLQGMAGGFGVVVARAVVRDLYSGVEAAKFFSRLTLIFGVAPIAAPALGSAVLKVAPWPGIFVTLGVIAALLTALVALRLPETLPPQRRAEGGFAETARAARTLLTDRQYLGFALGQGCAFAAMFAYISASSFVFQDGYGVSPTAFSLLFGLNAAGLITLSQANRRLLDHFPPATLLTGALVTQAVAAVAVLVAAAVGSLVGLAAGLFVVVASIGAVMPNGTALALDRYPERAGTAAALLGGIQSVVASVAAPLAGVGDAGTGVPMGVVIVGFAVLALLTRTLVAPRRPGGRPADLRDHRGRRTRG
ncbi:multidrug effflux MFS transporter [Krasilnikovia sp. MM14-A1259]|uniref:multidrug effflux MFS transporter n=1 Tax=Krasilnikovia sp. MM14-A1259 TaxID=3373539 RepID=UPI003808073B